MIRNVVLFIEILNLSARSAHGSVGVPHLLTKIIKNMNTNVWRLLKYKILRKHVICVTTHRVTCLERAVGKYFKNAVTHKQQ